MDAQPGAVAMSPEIEQEYVQSLGAAEQPPSMKQEHASARISSVAAARYVLEPADAAGRDV